MKLDRKLVIQKLEARIKELDREDAAGVTARARKHAQAVRAFNRIKITEESTYEQLTRAENLLREVRYNAPDNGHGQRKNYVKSQIEREIALLKLSSDETVSVRTNSSLADFLS